MKQLRKYDTETGRHYAEAMEVLIPEYSNDSTKIIYIYHKPKFFYMTKREDKS